MLLRLDGADSVFVKGNNTDPRVSISPLHARASLVPLLLLLLLHFRILLELQEWKSVLVECLRYLCLVSPHTFPNIVYGVLKRVFDKFPESHYERMVEKNNLLKARFQVTLAHRPLPRFNQSAHRRSSLRIIFRIFWVTTEFSYIPRSSVRPIILTRFSTRSATFRT